MRTDLETLLLERKISELCIKYHTPKVKLPWNELSHDYAPHYAALLAGRQIRRVLEIGLGLDGLFHEKYQHGDSLRVWAELFPNAEIYGLDIRADALLNEGRIHSYQCDQSDINSIAKISALFEQAGVFEFDLIVDDGSHKAKDQALTALTLGEMLSPGGVYIVEDVIETAELVEILTVGELKFHVIECSRAATMGDDRLLYFTGKENP